MAGQEFSTTVGESTASPSQTSSVVLPSNSNRIGVMMVNDTTGPCYLEFSPVASTTSYAIILEPGSSYTMDPPIYQGPISAIWSTAATGLLQITELQP